MDADVITEERPVATYAQPLSRLQVSWGAILAGALALAAVSFILWTLALAIIVTSTHATVGSLGGSIVAAWICAIVTTLIGAFVGGMVAGYLPGNPRRAVSVLHGFLAWALAFVLSGFIHGALITGTMRTVADTAVTAAGAAVQTAGAAVGNVAGGVAGGQVTLDQKAYDMLISLGYTPAEAAGMVVNARAGLQQMLRGQGAPPAAQQVQTGAQQAATQAATQVRGALDTLLGFSAVYMWLWWGTWLIAGGLAMIGAAVVVERTKKVPERERAWGSEPLHVATLRTARSTP